MGGDGPHEPVILVKGLFRGRFVLVVALRDTGMHVNLGCSTIECRRGIYSLGATDANLAESTARHCFAFVVDNLDLINWTRVANRVRIYKLAMSVVSSDVPQL